MTAPGGATSLRVVIRGRVQGVWFRAWTVEQARSRDLSGWVRNRLDGAVEALFAGPAARVEEMVEACWDGPPSAHVQSVDTAPAPPPDEPGFATRRTG